MRELISLIKVSLNVNFGISALKYKIFKEKKEMWRPLLYLIVIVSIVPTYVLFIGLLNGMFVGLKMINQEGLLLLLGFLATQVIVFVFGISYVISKFYFSNDLNVLIPMPIKPSNIIASKFIVLLVNEYLTMLPIILPIIIIYGINSDSGVLYWLYSLVAIITLPIIPLGISSVIVMLFMKITNIKGKRDLLRILGFVVLLIVIFGIQFGSQYLANDVPYGQEEEYFANLIDENNSLVMTAGKAFPPSVWATRALSEAGKLSGLLNLVLFGGSAILIFYVMIYLGEKIFYKGLIGGEEVATKKKLLSDQEFKKKTSDSKHPIISILLRDIKILVRTPVFMMNSLGSVIVIPIAMAMPIAMAKNSFDIASFYTLENLTIINLAIVGFIIFIGATNGVAATTFSREGKQFWISRILPVKVEYQLLGKILSALLVQLLAIVLILTVSTLLLDIRVSTIITVLVLGLLGSIPITELAMLVDIIRPLLDWDNPQKAMKQNVNVLFTMLIGIGYILLYGAIGFGLYFVKLNSIIIYIIFAIIFAVLSVFLFTLLSGVAIRRFKEIQ